MRFKGTCAATLAVAASGLVAAPPLRAEPPPPGPVVTFDANAPSARLQLRGPSTWQDVCQSPCGRVLDPAATYRVGGDALQPSNPFKLSRPDGAVFVQAKVVSSTRHGVGMGLDIVGGALGLLGAYWLYESTSYVDTQAADGTLPGRAAFRGLGVGALIVAGVLLAVGLPLSLSRTTADVR
jgi:hypothetical protein